MVTKKKVVKPKIEPPAPPQGFFRRHASWLSWSTLASVATVVVAWPVLSPMIPRFLTAEALEAHTAEHALATAKTARAMAWQSYRMSSLETLMLRNRLNECDPDNTVRPPARICRQYADEYQESFGRSAKMFDDAQKASK